MDNGENEKKQGGNQVGRGLWEKTEKGRDRLLVPETHVALQGGAGLRKRGGFVMCQCG